VSVSTTKKRTPFSLGMHKCADFVKKMDTIMITTKQNNLEKTINAKRTISKNQCELRGN